MKFRFFTLIIIVVAIAIVIVGIFWPAKSHGATYQHRCNTTAQEYAKVCIPTPLAGTGLEITDNNGLLGQLGTPLWIADHNGAPMLYDNITGLYSGGDGKISDGGNICITDRIWRVSACLYANGDLLLRQTFPDGSQGFTGILTPLDIRFLNCLTKFSLANCQGKYNG